MAKKADKYFKVDPWKIVEEGFLPEYGLVGESVFALGNEYMGVRGYFEEGYSDKSLLGSYFNGVYERQNAQTQGYKGIAQDTEFMVNSLDWLYLRIKAGEEILDLAVADIADFRRTLDLKSGLLSREFIWKTANGDIAVRMERLISMIHNEEATQRLTLTAKGYKGNVVVTTGLDFGTTHGSEKKELWDVVKSSAEKNCCHIMAHTKHTDITVESIAYTNGSLVQKAAVTPLKEEKRVSLNYELSLEQGETVMLEKVIYNITPLCKANEENPVEVLQKTSFSQLYNENLCWWQKVWEKSDIEIEGDEENQQGIRFCIFQMYQTYHGAVRGTNIGAKGLTGEAYNGNAFWDTETYCLPFFLFHDKEAAKNLLFFRYATLDEAKKRAKALDCKGAFYPIATISGRECCNLWQHASLQLQASTAVAYAVWMYEKVLKDTSFTEEYGLTMLIEICRMLATRGDYNADHTHYGYYGVMGPDEFQMMVNNNCYTNYMARFTFRYTLSVIERMKTKTPALYAQRVKEAGLSDKECEDWKQKAEAMYIPYDERSGIYEQHQGYFDLPHIDVDTIPVEDFPLYHHWTYDRIYRNDMIKQPDVLMFMFMFNSDFSEESLRRNYEYYEPRCIHESSLSPSVHSILAAQLKKSEEAFDFFKFATRMDLDNYNRNSDEGLHTTSIAAAWMNIIYGFGGLRSDGKILALSPSIPKEWKKYRFRIVYADQILNVEVRKNKVLLKTIDGGSLRLSLYGQIVVIDGKELEFEMPA